MPQNKKLPDNQITVYQTPDGKINIEVLYANENIWLSQRRIAELFDVDRSVVTKHLKNIFSENELQEDSGCANFAQTAEVDERGSESKIRARWSMYMNKNDIAERISDFILHTSNDGDMNGEVFLKENYRRWKKCK